MLLNNQQFARARTEHGSPRENEQVLLASFSEAEGAVEGAGSFIFPLCSKKGRWRTPVDKPVDCLTDQLATDATPREVPMDGQSHKKPSTSSDAYNIITDRVSV